MDNIASLPPMPPPPPSVEARIFALQQTCDRQQEFIVALSTALNYLGAKMIDARQMRSSEALADFKRFSGQYREEGHVEAASWLESLTHAWNSRDE